MQKFADEFIKREEWSIS